MPNFKQLERELALQHAADAKQKKASPKTPAPRDTRTQMKLVRSRAKNAIRSIAKRNRKRSWGNPELRYAMAYLEAMLSGDGKQPGQQAEWLIRSVQRIFAGACVELEVPDRTFPGQQRPWYPERKAEAVKFRKSRK